MDAGLSTHLRFIWDVEIMSKTLEATIKRVGEKYKAAPKPLRLIIGQILSGKIKLKIQGGKANE